ncbi:Crp/Fnr family transcriptional regulator [Jiulongibacter sediminis]|jgi:signal-transduction protein with cAMP-binding, CBS, and nucleotidyltransferase domain|uniref:Crp/Fnr family transcriptional regulator n=1 Tax=Jiulongibacter sediminis TaxID=1605367 RepID=UPI0026EDE5CB|nr:hypothetical protein [Jiulongibacter sediminis]
MRNLIETLETRYGLQPENAANLASKFEKSTLPKGALLLRPDDINNRLFYIEKGLCRSYTLFEESEQVYETTIDFYAEGDFMYVRSPNLDLSSNIYLQTLEWTVIYTLSKQDVYTTQGTEGLFENLLSEKVARLLKRVEIFVKTRKSKNKYEKFKNAHYKILPRLSDKMIVSYLMINPATLSRLRGDFS